MNKYIRICILTLWFIFGFGPLSGQNRDSLFIKLGSAKEDTVKAMLYYQLSLSYVHSSKDSATMMANKAMQLSKKLQFNKGVHASYGALGTIKFNEGNYNEALEFFLKSMVLAKEMGNKDFIANNGMNIATLFCINGNYKEALIYYNEAKQVYEENRDDYGIAKISCAIGIAYKQLKDFKEAIKYYDVAVEKGIKLNDKEFLAEVYNNIAVLYEEVDKPKALEHHLKALKYEEETKDEYSIAISNLNIGDLLNKMKEYKRALPHLISGLDYVIKTEEKDWELSAYGSLADSYMGLKDHEKANNYLLKQKQLSDSLFNEAKSKQLNEMETKYKTEKKELEILTLKEQNETARSLAEKIKLTMILIGSLAILSILLLISINNNRKKQKEIAFIKTKAELEQTALRAQMNPHFIFNALSSIQHYILSKETEYAYDYLAKFGRLIRLVLINSEQNMISLDKEIETLKLYIELEQRRFKNRFDFEIELADDFPVHDLNVPTMLIQPFVENAIWHGIMNLEENKKGKLSLGFNLTGKLLTITIEDNGIGRKEAALRKIKNEYESVGVLFTQKRLELIKAVTKQKAEIVTVDLVDDKGESKGTKVEILMEVGDKWI